MGHQESGVALCVAFRTFKAKRQTTARALQQRMSSTRTRKPCGAWPATSVFMVARMTSHQFATSKGNFVVAGLRLAQHLVVTMDGSNAMQSAVDVSSTLPVQLGTRQVAFAADRRAAVKPCQKTQRTKLLVQIQKPEFFDCNVIFVAFNSADMAKVFCW